jgi:glutathione S-transferase
MKLWHCADARSFRPLWALEALGLDYALELLPFPPRFLKPEYLQTNPLGTIPFFEDGATHMTESAAIVEYLATRYRGQGAVDLAVDVAGPDYGAWLNWLHYGEATLTFPQTLVLRYTRLEPEERRQPKVAADYARWFVKRTVAVENALAGGNDWLCAGRFTAADISVGYALLLANTLGLGDELAPVVQDYWQRLKSAPGFVGAKAAQRGASAIPAV